MSPSVRHIVFLLLALVLVLGGQPAQAKSSKSSFSSGGKSSSPSSSSSGKSSGWSNSSTPSTAPAPSQPSSSSSSGWGNSAPKSTPSAPSPAAKPSNGGAWSNSSGTNAAPGTDSGRSKSSFAMSGQTAVQKEASVKAYNEYKGKFAKPDNPVRESAGAAGPQPSRTWDNYRDYRSNRDNYYAGQGWSVPNYAYQSAPSFGLWDAMFLWFMLRQANGPSFMYNHQGDPGVQAFRQEADKLAASNADLKKQLADMDAKIDQMRKDGRPVDPKSLDGVDPSVALAAEHVVRENAPKASGMGSWVWILGAGVAVAALLMLLTRRSQNTRRR
ncbi:MAG: hypothetical protein B193_0281 [Solidesulfovibrio magneticus str. Maddingley MBC34]|uniref:Uncharacterized protein n=1 Tax=Solidesulfovibrio magneticus str. Maddingley MBC34 TaxID=1206767 RepID=K6GVV6_9BACT|nr:MAG: hypothetical protein B193_0281 [Solidesulfovibrio magneticus str. Maddingley MBC34]